MDNIPQLKELVCLLSCQPRDEDAQVSGALDCLREALHARAVGVIWRTHQGWQEIARTPADFALPPELSHDIYDMTPLAAPRCGENGWAWLVAPLKVGGQVAGRLWAIDQTPRSFSREDQEFAMMMGNQLALALENAHLYEDVRRLAARRAQLLRRVISSQDERCQRISRDLHDEISQSLVALALDMEAQLVRDAGVSEASAARLEKFHQRLLDILQEINRIILDLRPTLLEDLGLLPALEWLAHQRLETAGVQVRVDSRPPHLRLPKHLEISLYRIGQEAINNIAKHAQATTVRIELARMGDEISLTVQDDGRGFDLDDVLANADDRIGLGIFGMKERARLIGGRFAIQSQPGHGAQISVIVPLP